MDSSEKSYDGDLIGVDVGGTFTDLVRLDQTSGAVRLAKVASTLDNQAFGVMNAVVEAESELSRVALVIHGTTTTTNAVLERKLSRTGLITTAGFRDVLELGRYELRVEQTFRLQVEQARLTQLSDREPSEEAPAEED